MNMIERCSMLLLCFTEFIPQLKLDLNRKPSAKTIQYSAKSEFLRPLAHQNHQF